MGGVDGGVAPFKFALPKWCIYTCSLYTPTQKIHHSLFLFISLRTHAHSDPSLQVRACNLLGGYLTHKETNMRYLALESLSHLATSDLSREAVKKHQDTVLEQLKVSSVTVYM